MAGYRTPNITCINNVKNRTGLLMEDYAILLLQAGSRALCRLVQRKAFATDSSDDKFYRG